MATIKFKKKTASGGIGNYKYEYECTCNSGKKHKIEVECANDNEAKQLADLKYRKKQHNNQQCTVGSFLLTRDGFELECDRQLCISPCLHSSLSSD